MFRIENNYRPVHGITVGRGDGSIEPSVSLDRHPIMMPGRNIRENCYLKINTNRANPFYLRDDDISWEKNYLLMREPELRTLAHVAPLDRDQATSSKYWTSAHVQPCYSGYHVQYLSNGQPVPKAGYPHS